MIGYLFSIVVIVITVLDSKRVQGKEESVRLDANHRLFTNAELSRSEKADAFLEWSRSQLQTSSWPIDHGDTARSKYVFDAGLPTNVKRNDVKLSYNTDFRSIQWLYTGGEHSEWLYAMSGDSLSGFWVSKVNATTLDIVQRYRLQPSFYTGGMIIHRNGHVYAIHTNYLYTFWNGDLENVTLIRLPTELNGGTTLTNGMLVTHDGYLVVKQFSYHFNDIGLIVGSKKAAPQIHNALILITIVSLFYFLQKRIRNIFIRVIISLIGGYILGSTLALTILLGLFQFTVKRSYNWVRFMTDALISPNFGGGELKLIDPITLTVKAEMQLPERCSFARMALSTIRNDEDGELEDVIILLGDENVHQVRWRPSDNALYWIPIWSREYRRNNDGTFPGTGPSIYNGMTYFTDNTFPIHNMADGTYNMFGASIHHIPPSIPDKDHNRRHINYRTAGRVIVKDDYVRSDKMGMMPSWGHWKHFFQNNRYPMLPFDPMLHDHHDNQPGFMFWSTVINPPQDDYNFDGSVIVWDSSRGVVQGRYLDDPSMIMWQLNDISQADCITVIPDRRHIYLTDYGSKGPKHMKQWLNAISGETPAFRENDKFFLIADTHTGEIKVNITLPELGVNPTLIVPGKNNDVFIGAQKGLIRIFAN